MLKAAAVLGLTAIVLAGCYTPRPLPPGAIDRAPAARDVPPPPPPIGVLRPRL